MTINRETVRGLRAELKAPARSVAVRRAETEGGILMWQIETENLEAPGSRQTFTITNEALAAVLEMRSLLTRSPGEIVATIVRRDRANRENGDDFLPVRTEPTSATWVAVVEGSGGGPRV